MRVLFPGSFDPLTNGHLHIVTRLLAIADEVLVAVCSNPRKTGLFTPEERLSLLNAQYTDEPRVRVLQECGLVSTAALREHAVLVRAIRNSTDMAFEEQQARINRHLGADTLFVLADQAYLHISSSAIKELLAFGNPIDDMVPRHVAAALAEKTCNGKLC